MWRVFKALFWWTLLGALLAAVGGALFYGYRIIEEGMALNAVPPAVLAVDVMKLHVLALYGAGAGFALGLVERVLLVVWRQFRRGARLSNEPDDAVTPDRRLREAQVKLAKRYLARRGDAPHVDDAADPDAPSVENVITARNGAYTYRVMAYRRLTADERKQLVREALRNGWLEEPEPGGTATLVTTIGRRK